MDFGHELLTFDREAHIAVAGRKAHALLAAGREGALRITARHDDIEAVQIAAAPFDRPGDDVRSVGRMQGDTRAGVKRLRSRKKADGRHRQHQIHSFHDQRVLSAGANTCPGRTKIQNSRQIRQKMKTGGRLRHLSAPS